MAQSAEPAVREPLDAVSHEIVRALKDLRFGSVEVIVHDGRVVQLVRTEKLRLEK